MNATWPRRYDLASRARLDAAQALAGSAAAELTLLIGLGALAALLTAVTASPIRVPGHAILRGMLPFVLGLSLAPRRGAGSTMSVAAVVTWIVAGAFNNAFNGASLPLAAGTGLAALGPALDVVVARAVRPGWGLYLRFALAGLVANLAAFAVRMASEAPAIGAAVATGARRHGGGMGNGTGGGMGRGMGRAVAAGFSWPTMLASFALCGIVAGVLCGLIWFRSSPRSQDAP